MTTDLKLPEKWNSWNIDPYSALGVEARRAEMLRESIRRKSRKRRKSVWVDEQIYTLLHVLAVKEKVTVQSLIDDAVRIYLKAERDRLKEALK